MAQNDNNYTIWQRLTKVFGPDSTLDQQSPVYKFDKKETNHAGVFKGEFKIDFLDDGCTLIVPIREDLIIHILDSQTMSRIVC